MLRCVPTPPRGDDLADAAHSHERSDRQPVGTELPKEGDHRRDVFGDSLVRENVGSDGSGYRGTVSQELIWVRG
jgi:hypothetical protein